MSAPYRPIAIMVMLSFMVMLSWGQPVVAPPPITQTPGFSTATIGADVIEASEILSTTAQNLCARHTIPVARVAAGQLSVGATCTATDRCWTRWPTESQSLASGTTVINIAGGGATDNGKVFIYATRTSATAFVIKVGHDLPVATVSCAGTPGCTVVTGVTSYPTDSMPISQWTVAAGSFSAGGGTAANAAATCWLDLLTLTNKTAGAITVTASDVRGTPLDLLTAVSIAANTTYAIVFPGGLRFEGGLTLAASADDSINVKFRAIKAR